MRRALGAVVASLVVAGGLFVGGRAEGATLRRAVVDPAVRLDMAKAGRGGRVAAFVHFQPQTSYFEGRRLVRSVGLEVGTELPAANALYAFGPARSFEALARSPEILRLEANRALPLLLSTATWASRARPLYEPTGGLDLRVRDRFGHVVDGSGVGIAIVDTGVDALHPDLPWCGGGADQSACKTRLNFKIECSTPVLVGDDGQCFGPVIMQDVPDSDTTAGHGTHVSGIAAGSGVASGGLYRGVAPGAKLYGFGAGDGDSVFVLNAAAAFQWIIDHGPRQDPPIRVINNSYGNPGFDDQTNILTQLSNAAIARGITVVWAAGNSGAGPCTDTLGDPAPCTSLNANNRTPGNISVANYDDGGTGARDNTLESDSSQGIAGRPETYPTISAPGSSITSTCAPYITDCSAYGAFALPEPGYFPNYSILSGTSMAAPHVAGVVALVYEAKPDITPAEVQEVLEDTAHKFEAGAPYEPDPANPSDTTSRDKGHGLVDARAAVLRALGLPPSTGLDGVGSPVTVIADGDRGDQPTDALDLVSVALREDPVAGRVEVRWTVAGTTAVPSDHPDRYELRASIDGVAHTLSVDWDGSSVTCTQDLAADCTGWREGNTFVASYDAAALGARAGAPVFDVWALTFGGSPLAGLGARCAGGNPGGLLALPPLCASDRAPGLDAVEPAGLAAFHAPERGRPHVFTFTASAPPDPCSERGVPVLSDRLGDAFDQDPSHDVLGLAIGEPRSLGPGKIRFILRVASLASLPPSTTWPVDFSGADGKPYFVKMSTDATGTPSFAAGPGSSSGAGVPAEAASTYTAQGAIEIVVPRALVGAPAAGDTLHGFLTRVTVEPVGITPDNMPDSLTPAGTYSVVTSEGCDHPPVAADDLAATDFNTPATIDVLANDSDPDGDHLSLAGVDARTSQGGRAETTASGLVRYVPPDGFSGTDTFDYQVADDFGRTSTGHVSVTVGPNPPPVATDDQAKTRAGRSVVIDVLANDRDPQGDRLSLDRVDATSERGGTVLDDGDGTVSYTPPKHFTGTDTFQYVVADSYGAEATGHVTVTVTKARHRR